jgi:hypothetical protein
MQSVIFKHKSVILTRSGVITLECDLYTQSVISTRTRLVSARIVRFPYAECAFYTHESKFDTYACEYDTHECDFHTFEYDSYTPECNFYTQCDFTTRECDFNMHNIGFARIGRFPHATRSVILHTECAFYTYNSKFDTYACDIDKYECDSNLHECDFNTHKIGFCTHSKISIRKVWFYT